MVTTFKSASASSWLSADCSSKPEPTRLVSGITHAAVVLWQGNFHQAHIDFALEDFQRFSAEVRGHQHFHELLDTASAAALSTGRLKAMMPPNALVDRSGRPWNRLQTGSHQMATPQGLACLMITHAGTSKAS